MTEQIEIPLSKFKMTMLLIGSFLFVLAGLWFVFDPPTLRNPILGNPTLIFVTGIAAIFFFGLCSVFLIKKLPDKTPGLIINNDGITDNSGGVSVGLIPWTDIKGIVAEQSANQKFVMVIVRNPDDYINKQKGFIKKKAMQMNYNSFGSPISISANGLQFSFNDLYRTLLDSFERQKVLINNAH